LQENEEPVVVINDEVRELFKLFDIIFRALWKFIQPFLEPGEELHAYVRKVTKENYCTE
jgi:hypothetical protein